MIEIEQRSEAGQLMLLRIVGTAEDLWGLAQMIVRASTEGRADAAVGVAKLRVERLAGAC